MKARSDSCIEIGLFGEKCQPLGEFFIADRAPPSESIHFSQSGRDTVRSILACCRNALKHGMTLRCHEQFDRSFPAATPRSASTLRLNSKCVSLRVAVGLKSSWQVMPSGPIPDPSVGLPAGFNAAAIAATSPVVSLLSAAIVGSVVMDDAICADVRLSLVDVASAPWQPAQ